MAIERECAIIEQMLKSKNAKYGDSALSPLRVFSRLQASDTIRVRIDDKISRISNTDLQSADEDTLLDLIGYLVLLRIAIQRESA